VRNVANSPLPSADITGEQDHQDWLRNVADEWYNVTEEFSNDQLTNTQLVRRDGPVKHNMPRHT